MTEFIGLKFKPMSLGDVPELARAVDGQGRLLSGYTAATFAAWADGFGHEAARMDDGTLLVTTRQGGHGGRDLLQPLGTFGAEAQASVLAAARSLAYPLRIYDVTPEFVARHPEFCAHFAVEEDRGAADYVYLATDLAELAGRKYSKKRNLISQFLSAYPEWDVVPLTPDLLDACLAIARPEAQSMPPGVEQPDAELAALEYTLRNLSELGQSGLVLRVAGRPVAFSVYERLDAATAVVHFEKADRSYKGLYQMINRETARVLALAGYRYVNRESDLGDAGLRQAKMTYHPTEIVPAYVLTWREARPYACLEPVPGVSYAEARVACAP